MIDKPHSRGQRPTKAGIYWIRYGNGTWHVVEVDDCFGSSLDDLYINFPGTSDGYDVAATRDDEWGEEVRPPNV